MKALFVLVFVSVVAKLCDATCPPNSKRANYPNHNPQWVTILHTTDIHGWVAGHPHEPDLDADMGDWQSYIEHSRQQARQDEEELFVVDSGDLIEGTGISDASSIHGQYVFPIMAEVDYDALTAGNHDLGHSDTVELMKYQFIPLWRGSYVTTNTLYRSTWTPLGSGYSVTETALGNRILFLGFIYDFTQAANNTIVLSVNESVQMYYTSRPQQFTPFGNAMTKVTNVDLIVVSCHIDPTSGSELETVYYAIRAIPQHQYTPIAFLTGHRHIYDWKYPYLGDSNAFSIESYRFFAAFGQVSFKLDCWGDLKNVNYSWVQTDRMVMMDQLGIETYSEFITDNGTNIQEMIALASDILQLNDKIGCASHTYRADVPMTDPISFYSLYVDEVMPRVVYGDNPINKPFFITNNAAIRYDLFQGPITINDLFTSFPFNDSYYVSRSVRGSDLTNFLALLQTPTAMDIHFQVLKNYGRDLPPGLLAGMTFIWNTDDASAIRSGDFYDIISHQYDSFTFGLVFQTMNLQYQVKIEPYTEARSPTSTIALLNYIDVFMPCYASTAQLPVILAYLIGSILGITIITSAVVIYRKRNSNSYGGLRESAADSDSELMSSLGRVVGGQQNMDFEPDYVEFSPDDRR